MPFNFADIPQSLMVLGFFMVIMGVVAKYVFKGLFSIKGIAIMAILFYFGLLTAPNIQRAVSYMTSIFYTAAQTAIAKTPDTSGLTTP